MDDAGQGSAQGAGQAQGAEQQGAGAGAGAGTGTTQATVEEPFDKDRALSTIRTQREAETQLKEQLKEATSKLKTLEDEKLSETEKTTKRASEAEAERDAAKVELQELRIRMAATEAAAGAKARHPEQIWKLIPFRDVEFDANGQPTNIKSLVDTLRKEAPDYFFPAGSGKGDQGVRKVAETKTDMNDFIRKAAGRAG